MKKLFLILTLLSVSAFAKPKAAPYRMAELEETDASGYVLQTFVYTHYQLSEMKAADRTVSFEFEETNAKDTKNSSFRFVRKSQGDCGSTQYVGVSENRKMVLLDHSTRLCDDIKPFGWELRVFGPVKSVRYFRGNPKQVGDSKCQRFLSNTACIMLYSPTTCGYKDVVAEGSNSCFAFAQLKMQACEKGYDADSIKDEEIWCKMQMCALPMCAAPPEGCNYVPSNDLNDAGCPKYPCGLLVCPK